MGGKRNLVVTGWYWPDYMASAAAAYIGYHGDADVVGASMARLAGVLERHGAGHAHVDVLGVGLEGDLGRLAGALRHLAEQGITTRWISQLRFPMRPEAEKELAAHGGGFSEVVVKGPTLVEAVADVIGGEVDVSRLKLLAELPVLTPEQYAVRRNEEKPLKVEEVWPIVYQAAHFRSRDRDDDGVCEEVVRSLAKGGTWDLRTLTRAYGAMIDDYLMGWRGEMLGSSPATDDLRRRLTVVARADKANVMIFGETGVGKQVAAEFIHGHSVEARRKRPFAEMNCACAGDDNLLMDALFGHEAGAFTDARERRKGIFEDADGGTVFLDEIATAGPKVQAMLLKVLDGKPFLRIGGSSGQEVRVDVRVVCATNEDLQQMVVDGRFRHDLYERLCGLVVEIKPLCERMEDVEAIANNQWRRLTGSSLTRKQIEQLKRYDYPGNVRELVAIVNHAHFMNEGDFSRVIAERERANARIVSWCRERRRAACGTASGGKTPQAADPDPVAGSAAASAEETEMRRKLATLGEKVRAAAERHVDAYCACGRDLGRACREHGMSRNTMLKYLAMVGVDPVRHRAAG